MRTALSIAGSDSSGGAGIQADIKTMTANGVYAMTAVTALTAQNTTGVTDILEATPSFLAAELDAVFTDIFPDAVKIGMVSSAELITVIADKLTQYGAKHIVVDPVMVATSGSKLLRDDAIGALTERLLPLAEVLTPNIPEAEALTGIIICQEGDMKEAAKRLLNEYCCRTVLMKGGHFHPENTLINDYFLHHNSTEIMYSHPRLRTKNTHGTGCSLSSAIASYLAKGFNIRDSVKHALQWEFRAISRGADYKFGHGHGPINHIYKNL